MHVSVMCRCEDDGVGVRKWSVLMCTMWFGVMTCGVVVCGMVV